MNITRHFHLSDIARDGFMAKAFRTVLSVIMILFAIVVIAGLLWAVLQFLPWIEPYLRRFYTGAQIGWGLTSAAGMGGLAAAVIVWRA